MIPQRIVKPLLVLAFCAACASPSKVMDSWLQRSKSELLIGFGIPARSYNSGDLEILLFAETMYLPATTFAGGYGSSTTSPARTLYEYKIFYLRGDKVIAWRLQTGQVPPAQIDMTVYHK